MHITLKVALVTAGLALASVQAIAGDLPPDGTKNFDAPPTAPSYFTNETVPEPERVNHQATFDSEEVLGPAGSEEQSATPRRYGRHAYRSAWQGHGRYYSPAHSVGTARTTGKSWGPAGASRSYTPKHARTGLHQHAAATLPAMG
jgi:hypothetical protein